MKIAIVGGSAAGSFAALLLARAGHEVVVLERDDLEPAADVESAAAAAFRPTAPQIVQPHIIMASCRELLRERLPDVYHALLAAGVAEAPLATQMPASLSDTTTWPGDEHLTVLMTRRSTVDWVLHRILRVEPGVTLRFGTRVLGLRADPGDPPRVIGVHTDHGDIGADLVVDTTGRRSPIDQWLEEIRARPTVTSRAECGAAYFSRHYRLRPGATLPGRSTTRIVTQLDEFTVGIWGTDNSAMQLAVVPLGTDHRFRAVTRPGVFEAVLRTIPRYAAWLEVLDPISDVNPMGAVLNTLRRLVVDGVPVAAGLHALGDAVCCTNPTFGRGLSMALAGAADLVDILAEHGRDPIAQALALDGQVTAHVEPYYADQAAIDGRRSAMLRHAVFGEPAPAPPPSAPDRVSMEQLRTAARFDPTVFRALWSVTGMLRLPEEAHGDPQVVEATHDAIRRHGSAPPMAQPTRAQLLEALAG